jgi:hypothetical protein
MRAAGDRPEVGDTGNSLGVRVAAHGGSLENKDVGLNEHGQVEPTGSDGRRQGMSVTIGDPRRAPEYRLPKELGGSSRNAMFEMDADELPDGLELVQDSPSHAVISPRAPMMLVDYRRALVSTHMNWRRTDVSRFPKIH